MPSPSKGEKRKDFLKRCIPQVLREGTTEDRSQAAAICHSLFEKGPKDMNGVNCKADTIEVSIFNEIDPHFGFSSKDLQSALKGQAKTKPITVEINSIGGSVYEGLGICNALKAWQGEVTTINRGMAGSMAVPIFLMGDKRQMEENALLFIHNPLVGVEGNADELEETVELLRKTEKILMNIYTSRLKIPVEKINNLLKTEAYLTAEEALEMGFATEIIKDDFLKGHKGYLQNVVAKLNKGVLKVTKTQAYKKWLKSKLELFDIPADDLSDEQKTKLKAKFEEEWKARTNPTLKDRKNNLPPGKKVRRDRSNRDTDDVKDQNKKLSANVRRVDRIEATARKFKKFKLNAEVLRDDYGVKAKTMRGLMAIAIEEDWTADKFELAVHKAKMADLSGVGIHRKSGDDMNLTSPTFRNAVVCAMLRSVGLPGNKEIKDRHTGSIKKVGYEHMFKQEELEASDNPEIKNPSLHQMLDWAVQEATGVPYKGARNTGAFMNAVRDALWTIRAASGGGATSWSGLNIFDDAANKMLLAAYEMQRTTWQEWVNVVSAKDFKTVNIYRLTVTGGYEKVGKEGQLKHGGFTDDKYTVAADTYGKIVGLTRQDVINDDLGALNGIMAALGIEGARFLEELFYVHFLGQLTTLFPVAGTNNNYISGATTDLGVDGLTQAEQKFSDQVIDNAPIMVGGEILLVGTQDAVIANELFTKTNLRVVQTANAKGRPDDNPHVGKFRPVVSGYLNNTSIKQRIPQEPTKGAAITGQSSDQWFLLASPGGQGSVVNGVFLNGNRLPTIESGDPAFDILGLRWRAYHDAGVGNGDPKFGLMSKGAA